jgi:hypothetical protein
VEEKLRRPPWVRFVEVVRFEKQCSAVWRYSGRGVRDQSTYPWDGLGQWEGAVAFARRRGAGMHAARRMALLAAFK